MLNGNDTMFLTPYYNLRFLLCIMKIFAKCYVDNIKLRFTFL